MEKLCLADIWGKSGCRLQDKQLCKNMGTLEYGIGPECKVYSADKIVIGDKVTISQGAYLCGASHAIDYLNKPLITAPIKIERFAWICADAFVGMGVTIGEGAVVGARAAVFKDVEPWTVVGGNPARVIKKRVIVDD